MHTLFFYSRSALTLITLTVLLTGCPAQEETQTQSPENSATPMQDMNHGVRNVPPERMLRTQTSATYRVSYQPQQDPIPLNEHFRVTLNLQNLSTTRPPEKTVQVRVDADMPEHNHGMQSTPEVVSLGNGQYEVRGLLYHMAGYWEMEVTVTPESGTAETLLFGMEVEARPTNKPAHHDHS